MGLKILHSADWHLDSPFTGFSQDQQQYLKEAQRKLPGMVADICRRENCDLVLLAGDIFDGPAAKDSVENLKRALADCGAPIFISPGNHDFCAPGSPWLEETWPENVHVFTGGLESVTVKDLDCRVYGAGFTSMDCPGLLEGFQAEGEEKYKIAVLHGDPVQRRSPYCPVTSAQVRDSGLHYLALGHIHKDGSFCSGRTLCGWPGTPMGRGYDETEAKGIYLVEVEENVRIRRLLLDAPQFYDIAVNTDDEKLENLLPAQGNQDFYRVTLTGSGEVDTKILTRFPNLELRDHREAPIDIWASADADTLEGTYFRILREAMQNADEDICQQIQHAAEISRKILLGREVRL